MADDSDILPPGWTKKFDEQKSKWYYKNLKTKKKQWHCPQEDDVIENTGIENARGEDTEISAASENTDECSAAQKISVEESSCDEMIAKDSELHALLIKSEWVEVLDESGNVYYYNDSTGDSSWDKPVGFIPTDKGGESDETIDSDIIGAVEHEVSAEIESHSRQRKSKREIERLDDSFDAPSVAEEARNEIGVDYDNMEKSILVAESRHEANNDMSALQRPNIVEAICNVEDSDMHQISSCRSGATLNDVIEEVAVASLTSELDDPSWQLCTLSDSRDDFQISAQSDFEFSALSAIQLAAIRSELSLSQQMIEQQQSIIRSLYDEIDYLRAALIVGDSDLGREGLSIQSDKTSHTNRSVQLSHSLALVTTATETTSTYATVSQQQWEESRAQGGSLTELAPANGSTQNDEYRSQRHSAWRSQRAEMAAEDEVALVLRRLRQEDADVLGE